MKKDMALALTKEIAEKRYADDIYFHVLGEPLLHPYIFEIIGYANRLRLNTHVFTNGSLLDAKKRKKLIEANPRQVIISLQTVTEEEFETRAPKHITYDEYMNRIRSFLFEASSRGISVHLYVGVVKNPAYYKIFGDRPPSISRLNLGSLTRVVGEFFAWGNEICSELGNPCGPRLLVSSIADVTRKFWTGNLDIAQIAPDIVLTAHSFFDWLGKFDGSRHRSFFGHCSYLRENHFAVLADGCVTLCCMDYDGSTRMGNAKEEPLTQIMPRLLYVRRLALKGILAHPTCQKCLGAKTLVGSLLRQSKATVSLLLETLGLCRE